MKQRIRLSESDLHRLIKESVKQVLNEESYRKEAQKGQHTSGQFRNKVWDVINEALEKNFSDFSIGVGDGWDVTNPYNEDDYIHITFGY